MSSDPRAAGRGPRAGAAGRGPRAGAAGREKKKIVKIMIGAFSIQKLITELIITGIGSVIAITEINRSNNFPCPVIKKNQ